MSAFVKVVLKVSVNVSARVHVLSVCKTSADPEGGGGGGGGAGGPDPPWKITSYMGFYRE